MCHQHYASFGGLSTLLSPIPPEAIMQQMELLHEDFLVFLTESINSLRIGLISAQHLVNTFLLDTPPVSG
jgi:hypothetical protein